jgi:phosphatidate cytidylyltransferase
VAIIFGPAIIYISYLGGWWLLGMILFLAFIGTIEYLYGEKVEISDILFWLTFIIVLSIIYLTTRCSPLYGAGVFIGYFLLMNILNSIRNIPPDGLFRKSSRLLWGVAYLGLLWPFLYLIRELLPDNGGDWLLFLFGTLWLADTLAMFGGKAFGKRKLAPTVSPNKTIFGFFSGLAGGVIVAVIMYFWRLPDYNLVFLITGGLLVSLSGQMGDLTESCWKRAIGIKDSSAIIPGHGGVLDRFDSLLFAAPVLYFYLYYLKA